MTEPVSNRDETRPALLAVLVLLFAIAWFANLDYRKLVRPDEGRYAEIAREMAVTGDWVTPRLNAVKYFEKPPLQYWTTASAFKTFGEHEWTARLWTGLTGFGGVLLVFFAGRALFGHRAALYTALVLGSSFLYVGLGHINTLDMGMTFFMTLALVGFLQAQRASAPGSASRKWMLLAWAAMGLAVLSKGLIGLVLPGASTVAYCAVQRDLSPLKRLHPLAGILLLLLITAPWFVAVSAANPEFPSFFFLHEHFARFLTKVHHRTAPWWFFIPILILGLLPWTFTLMHAATGAWRSQPEQKTFNARRFLLIYAGLIFVFFSTSQSKLISYILPTFPALALLIGDQLARQDSRTLFRQILPVAVLALFGAITAPFAASYSSKNVPPALYTAFSPWLIAAALVMLGSTLAALYLTRREKVGAAVLALSCGGLAFTQLLLTGHETLSPSYSAYHIARTIRPYLKPEIPFYSLKMYEHTLPFYIKRTVTLVDYVDEFDFGLKQEPALMIPTMAEFETRWRQDPQALAIMGGDVYHDLQAIGLPMELVARDMRRFVVRKP